MHFPSRSQYLQVGQQLITLAVLVAFCNIAQAQYFALRKGLQPLEPYDIDYSGLADPAKRKDGFDSLHYIPFGTAGAYMTLGGEVREQFWSRDNDSYGLRTPKSNTYDLQRLIVDAYVHFNPNFAVFAQLGRYDQIQRINPSTTDEQRGRIQQGFFEVRGPVGPAEVNVHVGRQEIALGSGRFVWLNDSSNVRTTHDGVNVHAVLANGSEANFVYSRPTVPVLEAFNDFDSHNGAFAAAYFSQLVIPGKLHVDEYYFYRRNLGGQYAGLTGNEDRHTVGGRIWGEWGARGQLLYDAEFAYQFGTFEDKPIQAYGGSARTLYTFDQLPMLPGLQLQGSYFSGGGPNSNAIHTFSAPFPRPTMLNYEGLGALANLIEFQPAIIFTPFPAEQLLVRVGPEFNWRANVNDAIYVSRGTPLSGTISDTDKAREIGKNVIVTAQWRPIPRLLLLAEYLHAFPGPAVTLAGGKPVDAGVLQADYRF